MLKLEPTKKRVLPVELPTGDVIELTIKNQTIKQAAIDEEQRRDLNDKFDSGDIKLDEYMFGLMELSVEPFDHDKFSELEISHIQLINEELRKLQEEKPAEEKKTQ